MILFDTIDKSAYCSIGCISYTTDIETLQQYLYYNSEVISKFPKIIVAHTRSKFISPIEFKKYNSVWSTVFGDKCVIIESDNYGHNFGALYLDSIVIHKAKELGFNYTWKSTNDVLITENILSVPIDDCDFLYIQGHGITGLQSYYNSDTNMASKSIVDIRYKHLFPQTNFYIISNKIDYLMSDEDFLSVYTTYISDPLYKTAPEQIQYKYMLCECILRDCVWRNNLSGKQLISNAVYKKLLDYILQSKIADSSHKNIFFDEIGLCHYHFTEQPVVEL